MKNFILGIIFTILISFVIGKVYADDPRLQEVEHDMVNNFRYHYSVGLVYDNVDHVNCYVALEGASHPVGISCIKAP